MISVVIPTITGREHLLAQTVEAFEQTAREDLEIIIPRGHSTCGDGWNAGALKATGDFLMLAADDMIPHHGWDRTAVTAARRGVYPAPWIVNPDGSTLCCGTLGGGMLLTEDARDGLPVNSSPIPFMRLDLWSEVGPTHGAHYYSDDWLGYRARLAGLSVEVRRDFKFTHLDGTVGQAPLVARAMFDREMYAREVSKL